MKRMLIALDEKTDSIKVVEYVARQFGGANDAEFSLVHVLPNLPAIFWDEGHILSEEEKSERQVVVDKWLADQKAHMEPMFGKAREVLVKSGLKASQVRMKSISDSTDIADSILEEARDNGYETIVVGRCEHKAKHVLGSVSGKIVNEGRGMAIIVVE